MSNIDREIDAAWEAGASKWAGKLDKAVFSAGYRAALERHRAPKSDKQINEALDPALERQREEINALSRMNRALDEKLSEFDGQQVPERCSIVGDNVLRFLWGEAPLFGEWFHERAEKEKGAFWWRKFLPRPAEPDTD